MSDSIVIIPTYNEKENIELMIRKVFSLPKAFHLLIVDDNSPDGTRDIVKRILPEFEGRLHLLERAGKEGLGRAYIAGFKWCLQHRYEYIFEMDCDFSHNPEDLVKLYETAVKGADLVVGSRYKSGINVVNWPMSRVLMSYYASWYVRFITGMTVSDTTAGFVCYRRKVLETIELDKIKFKGYAFQIEMKHTAWKIGFKIDEVSIIFTDRTMGQSKMSKGIFKEAIWGVIELRLKSIFRNYPKIV
ncbi:MAG: polyprenol monophosphomannose synthase [Bacteroidia bacterium]|nr:polyprenol monophosphomannose synthase [Bacteroidia bacterium]MBP7260215.1 polyprenol monophosphomannose synthase [Bacteroidia bacterium]MBP9179820.1 polyprenol monophosphomannose synthase [Bacteroidia bacterium]MBP9723819.1 polyprenol monophosphomannose synthase [Bacteroidia bacterium]